MMRVELKQQTNNRRKTPMNADRIKPERFRQSALISVYPRFIDFECVDGRCVNTTWRADCGAKTLRFSLPLTERLNDQP
jgi:hypothetical protein